MYDINIHPDLKDAYASIKYYVWNYRISSWDKVYEDSVDRGTMNPIFKASVFDHIQNNEVRLRTHVTVGFLQAVWVYETKARLGYSLEVDCNVGETKCEGTDYYTCENYEWKNLGATIGQCEAECLVDANCQSDSYIGEKYCSNDNLVQKYRDYSCISYQCDYSDIEKVIKTCEFGCENGECNISPPPIPTPGILGWFVEKWNSFWDWLRGVFD